MVDPDVEVVDHVAADVDEFSLPLDGDPDGAVGDSPGASDAAELLLGPDGSAELEVGVAPLVSAGLGVADVGGPSLCGTRPSVVGLLVADVTGGAELVVDVGADDGEAGAEEGADDGAGDGATDGTDDGTDEAEA